MKLGVFLNELKNKSSQGRVRKSIDNAVDHKFSSTFLNNHKLSDDIRSFVCRGRLQILQCNSILHLYYNADRSCNLCNHPSETVSHILNGCKQLKDMYTKRHNRLVDLIYEKIPSQHNMSIIKDKTLTPSDFNDSSESFITTHRRPDITVIDTETRQVFLVEIAVPFDTFIGETYQNKFEKYLPLSREINQFGYQTKIIVLIIGSLGNVHKNFVSGLNKININRVIAKSLARYCSISAIIGSSKAWETRCRLSDN